MFISFIHVVGHATVYLVVFLCLFPVSAPRFGSSIVGGYLGPETLEAQRAGLAKATATLEEYPAQKK